MRVEFAPVTAGRVGIFDATLFTPPFDLRRLSTGPVLDMHGELNHATGAAFQPRIQDQVGECNSHNDNAAECRN